MSIQQEKKLFTDLSPTTSSQTNGGLGWHHRAHRTSRITVRFRYSPAAGTAITSSPAQTINITNPKFDDGSIINFGGSGEGINITNPDIDDSASLTF